MRDEVGVSVVGCIVGVVTVAAAVVVIVVSTATLEGRGGEASIDVATLKIQRGSK